MSPFTPTLSDIKQILDEVSKFYILVEKDLPENASQAFVFDMHKYAKALQEMIYDKWELEVPYEDMLELFQDCARVASKEESNYIKLTHHEWSKNKL